MKNFVSADGLATTSYAAMYHPKSASRLNALLKKYLPEFSHSNVGIFPMMEETWLPLDGTTPDGQPAFIPAEGEIEYRDDANYNEDVPIKADYVFGQGAKGYGYYHLLTRHAYVCLNTRIAIAKTPRHNLLTWLRGHSSEIICETEREEMYEVGALLYHRSHGKDGPGENTWDPMRATNEINDLLQRYIPEIGTVGLYPMKQKEWASFDGKTVDGEPAFVPYEGPEVEYREDNFYADVPLKKDYVFGTGRKGWGYHHLSTRHAWEILTQRIAITKLTRTDVRLWLEGHGREMTCPTTKAEMQKLGALLYHRGHQNVGPDEHIKL